MEGKYFKKLVGQKCYLSPISLDDVEYYTEWLNDFSVTLNLGLTGTNITLEKEKELLNKLSNQYVFAIIDKDTNKLIGSTGLHHVDFINGCAEFGINIGDKNFWNRNYGTEASTLMLDYAFNILNLNHIHLSVLSFNKRALKCYEKAGFKTIGKFTGIRQIGGERFDMVLMELLSKNFKGEFIKKALNEVKQEKAGMDLKLV
ncbi:MAG: GNAT family protein [Candidatus Cloacimonetes bacterium]|jgi:RimJ/RimL family protein N-acetyltransferase|nr:GNAT family N-acetyltransferase [Candidatus Cloacimonadota bacterium]MDD4155284.1 GNAT family protein [Candidatus Cloacimonadota bacterium]